MFAALVGNRLDDLPYVTLVEGQRLKWFAPEEVLEMKLAAKHHILVVPFLRDLANLDERLKDKTNLINQAAIEIWQQQGRVA